MIILRVKYVTPYKMFTPTRFNNGSKKKKTLCQPNCMSSNGRHFIGLQIIVPSGGAGTQQLLPPSGRNRNERFAQEGRGSVLCRWQSREVASSSNRSIFLIPRFLNQFVLIYLIDFCTVKIFILLSQSVMWTNRLLHFV